MALLIAHLRDVGNIRPTIPLRILLAEDNLVDQKVTMQMLRMIGYDADIAANGREVLQASKRQPYDIILMDVQMAKDVCLQFIFHMSAPAKAAGAI